MIPWTKLMKIKNKNSIEINLIIKYGFEIKNYKGKLLLNLDLFNSIATFNF